MASVSSLSSASPSRPNCPLPPALIAGLKSDLAAFKPRSITREAFKAAQQNDHRIRENDITAMFGIYNNTLHWLQPDAHPRPRNPQLYALADDLRAILGMHRVPDVEFMLNVDDYPKAQGKAHGVPVPLFSFTKRETRDASTGRTSSLDYDVLVPSGAFRMGYYDARLTGRLPGAIGWCDWVSNRVDSHEFGMLSASLIPCRLARPPNCLGDQVPVGGEASKGILSRDAILRHPSLWPLLALRAPAVGARRARAAARCGAGGVRAFSRQRAPFEPFISPAHEGAT